jgi:hypothetical protein
MPMPFVLGSIAVEGLYTEVCLNFAGFRLRITRAAYNPWRQDLWADIGPVFEPSTFFRMGYVLTALKMLEEDSKVPEFSGPPNTLAAIDAAIWAVHHRLAERLCAIRYADTKRTIQHMMHECAAMANAE